MSTIKVVDSTFSHNPAIGYAGERTGEAPKFFQWDTSPGYSDVTVFTDIRLKEAVDHPSRHKIALLLECPSVNTGIYEWIVEHAHLFDAILTHQESLVERGSNFKFYPFGGSWIWDWDVFPKRKMVSMLVSTKGLTSAHRLRHEVAKLPDVATYGRGVNRYVESKADALRDYRFAIVIENEMSNWWFTEKLIDAFSQGTVPIYRGCPDIGKFFDTRGMICWTELEEVRFIVDNLVPQDYEDRMPYVLHNFEEAKKYQCAEDWIYRNYGGESWLR